ncbi:S8/S53 family peptidase [Halomonas campisalis]|uniref:S8/S53 family peptidase n=1 Tax=Billgrantia campisalis TaxID=74661 RepID=A0ABS9P4N4_9GAMM|nr:S8/S53 family peptidase [Halomonas campisalis]MCG6656742.1 S8/S53 family peptidase [Halomonas campisalis]MDR5861931.1 S8/S53 family peptidase [Halomonas campisalis]
MSLIPALRPTLGVIDSGVPPGTALARFHSPGGADAEDRLGHGRAILATLGHYLPLSRLGIALYKLFDARLTADAASLAAAFEWQAEAPPAWLLCSLGLPRADERLQAAVARLQAAGTRIVAASPRFGPPVYPATWSGVMAVSGAAGLIPGPPQRGRDGRWYACVWGAREAPIAGDAWQPWHQGPPTAGTPPPLGGASFAAAHALGYWLAESVTAPVGEAVAVATGSTGQSG